MGRKKENEGYITQYEVEQYKLLNPLINGVYEEFKELSKKKPEAVLNMYKVKVINRVLEPIKGLLKDEEIIQFLDVLNQDDLPTNSDIILILNQYLKALNMFYSKYYRNDLGEGYGWVIK